MGRNGVLCACMAFTFGPSFLLIKYGGKKQNMFVHDFISGRLRGDNILSFTVYFTNKAVIGVWHSVFCILMPYRL